MESLALAFTNGWASGLNAYLVVLVLSLSDRLHDMTQVPDVLARTDVLAAAGALCAVEFVADKIPWVDSAWDAVSTVVRPTVGAVLGVLVAGEADTLQHAVLGVVGGGTALVSHLAKASTRLAINTSPEPVTNIGASLAEDVAVLGVVALAVQHPVLAASVAGVLLVAGVALAWLLVRLVRAGWRRWQQRRLPTSAPGPGPEVEPGSRYPR